jgi:hypothetical protein
MNRFAWRVPSAAIVGFGEMPPCFGRYGKLVADAPHKAPPRASLAGGKQNSSRLVGRSKWVGVVRVDSASWRDLGHVSSANSVPHVRQTPYFSRENLRLRLGCVLIPCSLKTGACSLSFTPC